MFGVVDVASAGELVVALAVFASALAIALASDSSVSRSFFSDAARCEDDVDVAEDVFDSLGVVFNSAGVEEHGRFRFAPKFCRFDYALSGDSGDVLGVFWSEFLDLFNGVFPTVGVFFNEVVVGPPVFDHQVEDAVGEGTIASWFNGEEEIGGACDWCNSWIDYDDLGSGVAGFPDVLSEYWETFGEVGAGEDYDLGEWDVAPRVGCTVDAECHLVALSSGYHAEATIVVDVGGF